MEEWKLILEIRKRWMWMSLFGALTFLVSLYLQRNIFPPYYESEVILYDAFPADTGISFNDDQSLHLQKLSSNDYLINLIYSREMLDHLIGTFGLFNKYQKDTSAPYAYEKVYDCLYRSISAERTLYGSIRVRVTDTDPVLAARIANEIAGKLGDLNKKFIIKNIEKKLYLYELILSEVSKESDREMDSIKTVISDLYGIMKNNSNDYISDKFFRNMQLSLSELVFDLVSVKSDLMKLRKNHLWLLRATDLDKMPSVMLSKPAFPGGESWLSNIFVKSFLLAIAGVFAAFLAMWYMISNKGFLGLLGLLIKGK